MYIGSFVWPWQQTAWLRSTYTQSIHVHYDVLKTYFHYKSKVYIYIWAIVVNRLFLWSLTIYTCSRSPSLDNTFSWIVMARKSQAARSLGFLFYFYWPKSLCLLYRTATAERGVQARIIGGWSSKIMQSAGLFTQSLGDLITVATSTLLQTSPQTVLKRKFALCIKLTLS